MSKVQNFDSMKVKKVYLILFISFSVLLISGVFYGYQIVKHPNILVDKEEARAFYIPKGADFKTVQDSLFHGGYVNDLVSFSFLAKLMKYNENVKSGRYLLQPKMTNIAAIRYLRSGVQMPVNITFNNIRLKEDLAEKVTKNIALSKADFLEVLNDPKVAAQNGFISENFMTMFIPNTYEVFWDVSAENLVERMGKEYKRYWSAERKSKADKIGLSPVEVSILASIVYAESKKVDEMPKVAGLYMNRINRNIALQADPTLIFAAQDFTIKRVLNKHKEIESPYNTYKYAGLPPGPINLPSIPAIDAVLNYKKHNYLFMCAKEDFSGYHNFAETLSQHMRYARLYQNELNKAKLYR